VPRVTCDVGYLCANFNLPRPLCSRLKPDVRDKQTSDTHHRLMLSPYGGGGIINNLRFADDIDLIAETEWLPNGKLLLLSLTKCDGVPCSLPSRITTKVLKNCKTFSLRPRPNVQDQDFHFCPRGASRPRPWSRDSRTTSLAKTEPRQMCLQLLPKGGEG